MKNIVVHVVLLLLLVGCGADEAGLFGPGSVEDGGPPAAALDGKAPTSDAEPDAGTGGAPSSSGGATAAGGRESTGGAKNTGGILASGGHTSTGGTTSSTGGSACTPVTHQNGLGDTWQDCEPLGTYTNAQATKACKASGAALCVESSRCGPSVHAVRGFADERGKELIAEWGYTDFAAGKVSPTENLCSPNDPSTEAWN